jgi:ketosteroid isomerase-like protein
VLCSCLVTLEESCACGNSAPHLLANQKPDSVSLARSTTILVKDLPKASDFDRTIDQYHLALGDFNRGDPKPIIRMFSHREDVSLANPLGPAVRGREDVAATVERAATHFREGYATGFETIVKNVAPDLAFTVEVEHYKVKVDGRKDLSSKAARVTSIFCREEGAWKLLHRHADYITSVRPAESGILE